MKKRTELQKWIFPSKTDLRGIVPLGIALLALYFYPEYEFFIAVIVLVWLLTVTIYWINFSIKKESRKNEHHNKIR